MMTRTATKTIIKTQPVHLLGLLSMLLSLSALATTTQATDTTQEQQQIADCKKITRYARAGQKAYNAGHHTQARAFFEDQAAWSHACRVLFQGEQAGFSISDSAVATADNNVALTYIRQKDYLKARAWLMINADDKKSQYNLNLIKDELAKLDASRPSKSPVGEYWQYAGNGAWNIVGVKQKGTQYQISFSGLYMGMMSMYYGPNMGEFTTLSPIKNGRAVWKESETEGLAAGEGCIVEMAFKPERVTLKTTQGECGFGHNVRADGEFLRASYHYTPDDLH
ncbi:MAG: tetratricopeptide repeat protein [Moraxellaceae bacterium]|nr:MAG: tetratricopeptide repeat protein [Moraxellaceae bacterium]